MAGTDPNKAGDTKDHPPDDSSTTAEQSTVPKYGKRRVSVAFILCFIIGFYTGNMQLLKRTGYIETDPVQDFVDQNLIPMVNESWWSLTETTTSTVSTMAEPRPGEKLARRVLESTGRRLRPKHPVVMIPGFVTSGLELWAAEECLKKNFRQRIWGGTGMAKAVVADRECWRQHLALHPITGLDPNDNIRIRAAAGFEAADYFISSFWVFGKLIQNLADAGYDPNTMTMVGYDWRLAFPLLEERDRTLTDIKTRVERMHEATGRKAVLLGHSMGNCLTLFFLRWVCEDRDRGGGGGGADWVERHVHSFVNVGGPLLGVPKAVTAIMSGEMRETTLIGAKLGDVLEKYLSLKKRKDLFGTWGSLWNMLPKGGKALWDIGADLSDGEASPVLQFRSAEAESSGEVSCPENGSAADATDGDGVCTAPNHTNFAPVRPEPETFDPDYSYPNSNASSLIDSIISEFEEKENKSVDDIIQFLLDWGDGYGPKAAAARYHSFRSGGDTGSDGPPSVEQWHNPVATPLPHAPSMKIYCLYGVGVETERSFIYRKADAVSNSTHRPDPPFVIDTSVIDPVKNIKYGVRNSDGDGSVPLLSLGYMCADGWVDNERLNPSMLDVVTREYEHEASFSVSDPMRSGPKAGEHCDILGNEEFTNDVLKIVTGLEDESVSTRIASDLKEVAKKINSHELGGLMYASEAENRYRAGPIPQD